MEENSKIFVCSWEFPPIMSGEGVVSLRTLKYSKHSYDVSCGISTRSLTGQLPGNICAYPLKGKYVTWPLLTIKLFKTLDKTNDYQLMISRVMPPNGHLAGLMIKLLKPKIKWAVYFSDPIWNSPFIKFSSLFKNDRLNRPNYLLMKFYGIFAKIAVRMSDLIIFNNERLAHFILGNRYEKLEEKIVITPYGHEGVPTASIKKRKNHLVIAHVGQVYGNRSLSVLITAVELLKEQDPLLYGLLKIQQVGFLCEAEYCRVQHSNASECFELINQVDYVKSLEYMNKADYLLIIDPNFQDKNCNMYVPAKIYDYMATGKPIIAITDEDSATSDIVKRTGSMTALHEVGAVYRMLVHLLKNGVSEPDLEAYNQFHCRNGIEILDLALEKLQRKKE